MKTILITLVVAYFTLTCSAQKKINVGSYISVTIPSKAIQFEDEVQKEKDAKSPFSIKKNSYNDNYKIDDLVLKFEYIDGEYDTDYLNKRKISYERMRNSNVRDTTKFKTDIKTLNDYKVFTIAKKLTLKNVIEYFCYDPKTRHLFRGIIESPSSKNVEANNLFMEVINNVKFNR